MLLVLSHREKVFFLGESRTVVPLLTNAASAPWRPVHASLGMIRTQSFPWP